MPRTSRAERAQQEILEYVRRTEEAVVDASRKWAAGIGDIAPGDAKATRKLIDDAFDLTETVLKTQREFVHSLVDTVRGADSRKRAAPVTKATGSPAKATTTPKKATKTGKVAAKRRSGQA
jgi:hypothetical protein